MGSNAGMKWAFLIATALVVQPAPPSDAVPQDAIPAILALFKTYRVVGLGEGPHGNEQGHRFRLSLIRDPRFPGVVNDIVVESGTARYQDVMDRFTRGENVPRQELRKTWEDTTSPSGWDRPIYEEFYRAVRDVNAKLPKEKHIRVLLGDPPIAWEFVRNRAELRRWNMQRDAHALAVIKREVLAKNRRALIVWGDGHFQGRGFPAGSITVLLERMGEKFFTISPRFGSLQQHQPSVAKWKVPSFARIKDTVIGRKYYAQFYPMPPARGWNTVLFEDQFDAVVYLGPTMTMSRLPASLCRDEAYMKMRLARLWLSTGGPGAQDPVGAMKKYCADVTRN
jgi:hypothetical protein